ncbi:MAG: hypothetical protein VX160_09530, partial [Actinomycetota bacterium]|nr:hypothetical protein [Actinomycetota bacterium]
MGAWITGGAIPFDTEGSKPIFAGVVVQTANALRSAITILTAQWRRPITATIIGGIADNTGVRHALTRFIRTVPITDARHTFRAINAIDTERRIVSTAVVIVGVADLTGTRDTRRRILTTVVITETTHTHGTASAERGITSATTIVGHVAELTGIVHALSIGASAITIDDTGHTLVSAIGIHTQWGSTTAA